MKRQELFSDELYDDMIARGYITARRHPTLPLTIAAYSDTTHFEQRWNEATEQCRGLIFDDDHNIVARPYRKFFNLGDKNAEFPWDAPAEVTDKMDGSLGILWTYNDQFGMATKGSFTSTQAEAAETIFVERYAESVNMSACEQYTFLFEILLPWNRIVVHYGDMQDLFLLGAVHTQHGYYLGPNEAAGILGWPGPVTKVMPARNVKDALAAADRRNAEGVVIRSGNKMVKLKQNDYLIAHRIVSNLSPKFVWDQLREGKTVAQICKGIPDEFYAYVEELAQPLRDAFVKVKQECYNCFTKLEREGATQDRKRFAQRVASDPHRAALFRILDDKDINAYAWGLVKPKADAIQSQYDTV